MNAPARATCWLLRQSRAVRVLFVVLTCPYALRRGLRWANDPGWREEWRL